MSALSPGSGIQVSSVYPTYTHIKGQCPLCVCVCVCVCVYVRACVCVCVCVAKSVAVELRCHATALILVIGKAQFRRALLSCDSSCYFFFELSPFADLDFEICNHDISKTITARSFKLYQLIEADE